MNDGRPSVQERLTTAVAAGGDQDVVAALGMAQAAPGGLALRDARALGVASTNSEISAIGAHLTRLQAATTQLTYNQARESIQALVVKLNTARRWGLRDNQRRRVAEGALLLHLYPTCVTCCGRGYELIPGALHRDLGRQCRVCGGTGQRPYPRRHAEQVEAVLAVLGWIQGLMELAVAKRLGR